MQAKLISLTVRGFRSFSEKTTVEFPSNGLVLFRGHNKDTGGSSGSGKSSLLLAIAHLFGFCPYPSTALQSWQSEEPMEVRGMVQLSGGELMEIVRGKSLALYVNGLKQEGSARQLEAFLTLKLGLNPEMLAALTYRGQKQPGLFLSKTDAEKKEFLTQLLDLGKFEDAVEDSQTRVRMYETNLKAEEFLLDSIAHRMQRAKELNAPFVPESEKELVQALKDLELRRFFLNENCSVGQDELDDFSKATEEACSKMSHDANCQITEIRKFISDAHDRGPDFSGLERYQDRYDALEADLKQAEEFLKEEMIRASNLQKTKLDLVISQLAPLEKKFNSIPHLEAQLTALRNSTFKMDNGKCYTCDRPWEDARGRSEGVRMEMEALEEQVSDAKRLEPGIKRLKDKIQKHLGPLEMTEDAVRLSEIINQLSKEIKDNDNEGNAAYAAANTKHLQAISEAQDRINYILTAVRDEAMAYRRQRTAEADKMRKEFDYLSKTLRDVQNEIAFQEKQLIYLQGRNNEGAQREQGLKEAMAYMEEEFKNASEEHASTRQHLNAELDFQKLVGREGFLGAIFEEVLFEIGDEANRLLGQFPNTAHVSLAFRSESVTQKGVIKKAIVPVVRVGGNETTIGAGLSGGMQTAVELAVDLAMATVVSRRTGAMPGWLILDESFTGLGAVEAEASLGILQSFADGGKLVLVVDHSSETKASFSQFIDVEYSAGRSIVK